jgi:hypothetical protein
MCSPRQCVKCAARVRVVVTVEVHHLIKNGDWTLRGRSAVEIHQIVTFYALV